MAKLEGKVALITGAAVGLGEGIARGICKVWRQDVHGGPLPGSGEDS